MKKNLALLLLLGILHVPFLAQAQTTTYTPQLHLALPPAAPGTWGEQYNNNFSTLDSAITGTFGTAIAFSGDITPAQITADQTDYNPSGLSTANVLRLSSDAARSINSLAGGTDGRTIILYNVGAQEITLKNNSGIGSAANQFLLNADVVLGINQGAIVQYDSTSLRWRVASSIGSTGAGAAHVIQDETSNLTARPTLNFTGAGVTCTDNSGSNRTDCTVPGGSTDVAAAYTWTGAHSWRDGNFSLLNTGDTSKILKFDLSGFTASTTRTWSGPNASTRLLGDSDFGATGLMTRTGSNAYTGRTFASGNNNYLAWTNANGIAGNPSINIGPNVLTTDRSATISGGDFDFGSALSFAVKRATNYAPTTASYFGYDSVSNRFVGGNGTATKIFSFTDEVQPLNAKLTAFAALTGVNHALPIFTGASSLTTATLPSCLDSAGNHLNYDPGTRTFICGASGASGLSGLVTNNFLLATSATTASTSSSVSETAGVLNAGGGLTVGNVSTNKLAIDPAAVTGTKTLTAQNSSGLLIPCDTVIANYTDAHVLKVVKVGSIVTCADGGAAGTGTWSDTSTNTAQNKTIRDALAGGTGNALWTPLRASWDGGSITGDGTYCPDGGTVTTINSGPRQPVMVCAHNTAGFFDGQITIPITTVAALGTVKFILNVSDVDSSSQHFSGTFKAMCRRGSSGDTINGTWGTTQSVDITLTTANNIYSATSAAVTPNGTCAAGAVLFWRFSITNSGGTDDDGDARVISVGMEQAS